MNITTLIDKQDTSEIVRDEIAAILVAEVAGQKALALADAKDPREWELRVFLERNNPWGSFLDPKTEQLDNPPIVNVSLDSVNYEPRASNVIERQKGTGTYHIDCYGYGLSEDDFSAGHTPGDERAALEAQRAVRLVRNILMAGYYTYLGPGLRGTVWKRWMNGVTMFQPQIDNRAVQNIVAARLALQVEFNEFSPQVVGDTIDLVSATVKRQETGEVYFVANYP